MITARLMLAIIVLTEFGTRVPASTVDRLGTIVVSIEGFRNAAGHARVALFNHEAGFPDSESAAYRKAVVDIDGGRAELPFADVPPGEYAVAMYHDENDDGKLNKGLFGIPKEGYGVSNNLIHVTRAPRFTEARFQFDGISQKDSDLPHSLIH